MDPGKRIEHINHNRTDRQMAAVRWRRIFINDSALQARLATPSRTDSRNQYTATVDTTSERYISHATFDERVAIDGS